MAIRNEAPIHLNGHEPVSASGNLDNLEIIPTPIQSLTIFEAPTSEVLLYDDRPSREEIAKTLRRSGYFFIAGGLAVSGTLERLNEENSLNILAGFLTSGIIMLHSARKINKDPDSLNKIHKLINKADDKISKLFPLTNVKPITPPQKS